MTEARSKRRVLPVVFIVKCFKKPLFIIAFDGSYLITTVISEKIYFANHRSEVFLHPLI